MAGRYLITGAQIGILTVYLKELTKRKADKKYCLECCSNILKEIQDNQFVGHSIDDIQIDVKKVGGQYEKESN